MNSYVRAWKKPLGENSKRLNMYYIYIALDCLNWERPPFRLARKLAWFWSRLARYLIFLAKYPFFQLRISWLIGANGSGFIFLEPSIRLADSQFANRVLGQSSNLSGYKKSPKSLIYKAKKERTATKRQKEHLQDLLKYHRINMTVCPDFMSGNEISRMIDRIIFQYGKIPAAGHEGDKFPKSR